MSEHSVQTAHDNSKLVSKTLQTTLVLYSFKLVLYLDTTAISNQIKYYLTTNRDIFLDIQYSFYKNDLRRSFTKNIRNSRTWLFGALLWKIIKALRLSSIQVSLFLLIGGAGIVNVQICGMHWYLNTILVIIFWHFLII